MPYVIKSENKAAEPTFEFELIRNSQGNIVLTCSEPGDYCTDHVLLFDVTNKTFHPVRGVSTRFSLELGEESCIRIGHNVSRVS